MSHPKPQFSWHSRFAMQKRETLSALSQCGAFAGHLAGAALVTADPFCRLSVPFDLGRTTQNMMLAAWEQGIGSVVAAIYRPGDAAGILNVPEGYRVAWGISFGYPAEGFKPARMGVTAWMSSSTGMRGKSSCDDYVGHLFRDYNETVGWQNLDGKRARMSRGV